MACAIAPAIITNAASLSEERAECLARIGCAHEGLADQKHIHAMAAHLRDVALRNDTAFGDDDAIRRRLCRQIERRLQRNVERPQIAVIDADERGLEPERSLELALVV